MRFITFFILSFIILTLPFSPTLADDCPKAIELFNQGTLTPDAKIKEQHFKDALTQPCDDQTILAKIHNNLADAFENQSKFKEAIAEYKKAIELDPSLPTPYISLGDVYSKLKDHKSAEGYYKKYYDLTHFKTRGLLRSALTLQRYMIFDSHYLSPVRKISLVIFYLYPFHEFQGGFNGIFLQWQDPLNQSPKLRKRNRRCFFSPT